MEEVHSLACAVVEYDVGPVEGLRLVTFQSDEHLSARRCYDARDDERCEVEDLGGPRAPLGGEGTGLG